MKIELEKYNPGWGDQFTALKQELMERIGFANPRIEHIGSTSVKGLSAKPIIDILIGLAKADQLEDIINPLIEHGYIYYEVYNDAMPYRRFFVKHKADIWHLGIPSTIVADRDIPRSTAEHNLRLAHVHILAHGSKHWVRHIAFRDYLREHQHVLRAYQALKEPLIARDWHDGNDYNRAKDAFIKEEEKKAVEWYTRKMGR